MQGRLNFRQAFCCLVSCCHNTVPLVCTIVQFPLVGCSVSVPFMPLNNFPKFSVGQCLFGWCYCLQPLVRPLFGGTVFVQKIWIAAQVEMFTRVNLKFSQTTRGMLTHKNNSGQILEASLFPEAASHSFLFLTINFFFC